MTINFLDIVKTPNGPGVYQGRFWDDGTELAMVSHKITDDIKPEVCQDLKYFGGIWKLGYYLPEEVTS